MAGITTGGGYDPGGYKGVKPRPKVTVTARRTPNQLAEEIRRTYQPANMREFEQARGGIIDANRSLRAPGQVPQLPSTRNTGSGSSRSGGGGGGGGGAAAPVMTQAQLNALMGLMGAGGPQAPATLDLPDYQAYTPKPFDDSYYTGLQGQWNQGIETDVGTAAAATQNLMNFLSSNYQNAYTNPNNTYATAGQAPGMDQTSMGRMLQAQGVNPNVMAEQRQAQATADAGFGNLWKSLAGNEDSAQRNRLGTAQMYGTDAANRIRAIGLGGTAGINQQKGQAKSRYDQQVEQWAREDAQQRQQIDQQEALLNWQQGNTYSGQQQDFRNSTLQALLGLMPEMVAGGLGVPTAQQLGWGGAAPALGPRPAETAGDPHHWAQIDWDLRSQGLR